MAGNTFGTIFRVTTWGESHGIGVGAVIDGCPPGLVIDPEALQREMNRRRPGQGGAASPRKEADRVEILSGLFTPPGEELPRTTGTPLSLVIYNQDAHSRSYDHLREIFRPGHGDLTYLSKYGIRDHRRRTGLGPGDRSPGGGRWNCQGAARQIWSESPRLYCGPGRDPGAGEGSGSD